MIAGQNLCHVVPNAPGNEGYSVSCDASGAGVLRFCADRGCSQNCISTPFTSEACLPNPPQFGAASVAVRCPGTPPAPVVPFVAAGGVRGA